MLAVRLESGSHRRLALAAATLAFLGAGGAQAGTGGAGAAQVPDGQPRILATGDSMMRYTDGRLKTDLLRTQDLAFFSDIRIGTGISKAQDNWTGMRADRHASTGRRPRWSSSARQRGSTCPAHPVAAAGGRSRTRIASIR